MSLLWKNASGYHNHPTEERVQHIIDNYGFEDAPQSGARGKSAWQGVVENYIEDHPHMRQMREDIRQHGIQEPIRIDYHRDPPVVTDGHTRLWHAHQLGLETVPVKHGEFEQVHYWEPEGLTTDCEGEL